MRTEWHGLLDPTSCHEIDWSTWSILQDCNAVNSRHEPEMKSFIFTPPHSTKDLIQLEIHDNVNFICKWYSEEGGGLKIKILILGIYLFILLLGPRTL